MKYTLCKCLLLTIYMYGEYGSLIFIDLLDLFRSI